MDDRIEFQNATIVDGTGRTPQTGHVLVEGETIRRVDETPTGATREIDLDGAYLTPGFIDMHSHSDLRLFEKPTAAENVSQGITTEVLGQDGVSVAPVPSELTDEWENRIRPLDGTIEDPWQWTTVDEYLEQLEAASPGVNCAYYAPHGNLRSLLAGFEDRPLERDEVESLRAELTTAIDDGAFGLSTGMIYPPSSYARDDELVALAETLAERKTLMVSHVWNETDRVVESIDRYLDICHRGGCHAHVSHLKVGGEDNWGTSKAVLALFDDAADRGQHVTFDQYPYTSGSTMLSALLPPWARTGDAAATLERLRDDETRTEIAADIDSPGDWENLARAAGTWENILITRTASGRNQGRTIAAIAADRDCEPIDAMFDLLLEEALDVTMVDFIMAEEDIERFLADPRGTFCTDGIFGGKPHPRAIGAFPRILERYVREREVLPIETAVYKAAGQPAAILGLSDRGRIAAGYKADLVAFDLDQVRERGTYEEPMQLADGIEYVLVNGTVAVDGGESTASRSGRVLRSTEEWGRQCRPAASERRQGLSVGE
ncbi:D-aminoacylase [Salinadaptatus halalkaliphilus]|uniref:D-aminoacylase n=1 Tax=Salinadaptatus halalkaliphilus TaxID=2419781 RepID=A0A4S3TN56_9EURY|nr:D-aminoacylase [Salinadaptatus halalkaliphilus]THE65060.1 D-aminoacylase [Salinadaptatus halalkaliphilus]